MEGEKTVLGPTVEIEGEIEGEEDLVIQGRIQGKIVSRKDLTVDGSGKVEASVTTKNLAVSGMLVGNVTASERVEVRKEGKMIGDIKAPRVIIADGAKFKGNIEMGVD
ncbi:MAG TPA: polymer-forming cytoskeletal protein [Polyangia bacterium]|jgi:cytoskeletal protein CcmA (bactofilin family)